MNSPTKSPARGGADAKANSTLLGANESDIYDFDTEVDNSLDQSSNGSKKNSVENPQKIIHPKKVPAISPTEQELAFRKTEAIDITSDNYIKLLKCTGSLCRQVSLKNMIMKGKKVLTHPLLGTLFCKICKDYYLDGEFSMDEDNEDKYCRWCGQGGTLCICSKCVYGFCMTCIKRHFGTAKSREVKSNDNWLCFYCNPTPLWKLRAVAAAAIEYSKNKKTDRLLSKKKKEMELDDSDFEKNAVIESSEVETYDEEDKKPLAPKKSLLAEPELPLQPTKPPETAQNTTAQNELPDTPNINLRKRKSSKDGPPENENDKTAKKLKINMNPVIPETPEASSNPSKDSSESGIENDSISENTLTVKNAKLNLKGMYKITQMTSTLCNSICKKRIHGLKNVNTYSEFCKEYDKIVKMHRALTENLNDMMKTTDMLKKELSDTFNKNNNGHSQNSK